MKFLLLVLLPVFLLAFPVCAAVYEWKDENGVVNFTDDPANIPAKYLKRVKKRPSITVESPVSVPPPASEGSEKSPVEEQGPSRGNKVLFGGHDEQWWRNEFSTIRNEMKVIQEKLPGRNEALAQARRKFTIYQSPQYRKAYYDLLGEIQMDEARLTELGGMLEALETEAARAEVPLEWRK
jgi:hypothetical protein